MKCYLWSLNAGVKSTGTMVYTGTGGLEGCMSLCGTNGMAPPDSVAECYGVDYNKVTKQCYLLGGSDQLEFAQLEDADYNQYRTQGEGLCPPYIINSFKKGK